MGVASVKIEVGFFRTVVKKFSSVSKLMIEISLACFFFFFF